jgi:OmpA-OmpF porin, OOP family
VHNTLNLSTDVLFATGSATLAPNARLVIDQVAELLASHHVPGVVEVDGYTDNAGTPAFNLALSQQRADAGRAALRAGSRQPITLIAHGFGEQSPLATNGTPAGRQHNRRVTIHLPPSSG